MAAIIECDIIEDGIIIKNRKEVMDETRKMLNILLPDKKGGKRSKKGGVINCTWCGKPLSTEFYQATSLEKEEKLHSHCKVIAQNRERCIRRRKRNKTPSRKKEKKKEEKGEHSPFGKTEEDIKDLKMKLKRKNREPTPKLTSLIGYIEELKRAHEDGTLNMNVLSQHLENVARIHNAVLQEQRALDEYERELMMYYYKLIIWCLLEVLFYAIGFGVTLLTYEKAVWFSHIAIMGIEQVFPTYFRKKLQLEAQRQERDAQIAINIMDRDRQIRLRRRIQEGIRDNPTIKDKEREELIQKFDNEDALVYPTSIDSNTKSGSTDWQNLLQHTFSNLANGVEDFVNNRKDTFIANKNRLFDKGEDVFREFASPYTVTTETTGEGLRFIAELIPLVTIILIVVNYYKIVRKTHTNLINPAPKKPFHPDDPRRDPKGDGSGSGQGGYDTLTTEGVAEIHGGTKHRKKTRKKRRKTRRKSKKRKSKRRRRKKTRKKRR